MLEDLKFVLMDYFVWLKRRILLFLWVSLFILLGPLWLAKEWISSCRGIGWFSDPLGKPSFFRYASDFTEFLWTTLILRSTPASEAAIEASKNPATRGSGDGIVVKLTDDYVEFQLPSGGPTKRKDLVGVIIIPGGQISPFAYSPLARALARKGYASFILRLPFNLAYYGWDTAGVIIKRPQTEDDPPAPNKWVLIGHSLGGVGLNQFTNARPDCVNGVVYMGCSSGGLKADLGLPMLYIFGSRDPFTLGAKEVMKDAEVFIVKGGNHRGFASYDKQPLDWEATIDESEQRRIVVEVLTEFIERRIVSQ